MTLWLKKNWLTALLILIIIFLGSKSFFGTPQTFTSRSASTSSLSYGGAVTQVAPRADIAFSEAAPVDTKNRMYLTNTNLSLLTKNVDKMISDIQSKSESLGGYLVDSSQGSSDDNTTGGITVRVPTDKLAEAISYFKSTASKVVSENISGSDVTDEFVDIESRLAILNQTKQKYQEFMSRASTVTDLVTVQRELSNLQVQIDSLVGQKKYYEQSAKLSKITIYLSTDEIALPYSPSNEWRPVIVFKTAVRSLIVNLRNVGNAGIWIVVYSPIIAIIYLIYRIIKSRRLKA